TYLDVTGGLDKFYPTNEKPGQVKVAWGGEGNGDDAWKTLGVTRRARSCSSTRAPPALETRTSRARAPTSASGTGRRSSTSPGTSSRPSQTFRAAVLGAYSWARASRPRSSPRTKANESLLPLPARTGRLAPRPHAPKENPPMVQKIKRLQRGFTLVELMIVVAIVAILAALAVYGVSKYVKNANTAEARDALGSMAKDAVAAFQKEAMSSTAVLTLGDSSDVLHKLCP